MAKVLVYLPETDLRVIDAAARKAGEARRVAEEKARAKPQAAVPPPARQQPPPPVGIRTELPPLELQETVFPLSDLKSFSLRERASLWWVSNQSDDLLCLPYCRIERFDSIHWRVAHVFRKSAFCALRLGNPITKLAVHNCGVALIYWMRGGHCAHPKMAGCAGEGTC